MQVYFKVYKLIDYSNLLAFSKELWVYSDLGADSPFLVRLLGTSVDIATRTGVLVTERATGDLDRV